MGNVVKEAIAGISEDLGMKRKVAAPDAGLPDLTNLSTLRGVRGVSAAPTSNKSESIVQVT